MNNQNQEYTINKVRQGSNSVRVVIPNSTAQKLGFKPGAKVSWGIINIDGVKVLALHKTGDGEDPLSTFHKIVDDEP